MRNPSYDAYFSSLIFGPLLAGKWAWPQLAHLMFWGLQTRPRVGPLGGPFGKTTDLEIIFSKCLRVDPPINEELHFLNKICGEIQK